MSSELELLKRGLKGRYQPKRELGQGGMATVYLAEDLKHNREVAIKVLKPELAVALGPERFLREIDIAARLQHPHIVPLYDSGEVDGRLFYVMPYVSGESLKERLEREGPLDSATAVRIAGEVAGVLDFAHRQGVVHRDIKPANILLSDGHAQVADFGIARAISVSAGEGLTQAGASVGTPAYMSPEQALGQEVDGRSDIYSLGCVLYEMLSGRPPFEGNTPQSVIAKTISQPPPTLKQDPQGFQKIIERAMAKEPDERYQGGLEFREALVSSGSPGWVKSGLRSWVGWAAAAPVLLLVAFFLWPRGWSVEGDPRKSLIFFPFENKSGDQGQDYLEEAAMNLLGLAASHWEDVRVYDDERTASLMRRRDLESAEEIDFDAAQEMAREAKVGTLVLGDIRREGDSLAIEAKVHDVATGDRLATEIARAGWDQDPRPLFDSLAARVLEISGSVPGERPDLLAQTTTSLEAYRAYLRGSEALQKFQIDSARHYLSRAVELDSGFALAYLRLRDADGWAGPSSNAELQRLYMAKARQHSASLPPRIRTLVEYHSAFQAGQFARARELAGDLIERDSTDVEAWYQLGEAHYHDNGPAESGAPRGNLGKALRAFERVLALDSAYVLAYQHILDALTVCVANPRVVCLPDSSLTGPPEDLERILGEAEVDRLFREAAEARREAAYAWVTAAPDAERARPALIQVLMDQKRFDEARVQMDQFRMGAPSPEVSLLEARILVVQDRFREASDSMAEVLRVAQDTGWLLSAPRGMETMIEAYTGAGKLRDLQRIFDALAAGIPAESIVSGQTLMPKRMAKQRAFWESAASVGLPGVDAGELTHGWLDTLSSRYGGDSATYHDVLAVSGPYVLTSYVGNRDTTLLSRFVSEVDTSRSRTWRTMNAHLALARGDSAMALDHLNRIYRQPDALEFRGFAGWARRYAWADLLVRSGELEEALRAYGALDQTDRQPALAGALVRSWADRAAVLQELGRTGEAIEYYQRFIDAWSAADPGLAPYVERARQAVAALRGEIGAEETG